MNWKAIGLALVLADFVALSLWTLAEVPLSEVSALVLSSPFTITLAVDLVIALSLAAVWMVVDARERGVSAIPYLVLTATFGSVGPLFYLLRRELARGRIARAAEVPA